MDDKRIVVGEDFRFTGQDNSEEKSSIIFVYDSFTLEFQCVFEAPGAGHVKDMQIQGDLLFCSFQSKKSIYVWNLKAKQIARKLYDDISSPCFDGLFHAAHGLLISCYNVASGADFQKDIDGDAHLIIRRIHSPTRMVIERKEHLPLWEINQVESDANFFAVSLSFGVPESREIQLRSKSDFQVIHRIEMSLNYKMFALHHGQLLIGDIISNRIQIKFWDIRKFPTGLSLTLTKTLSSSRTLTETSRVSIHCGHLIIIQPSIKTYWKQLIEVWNLHEIHFADSLFEGHMWDKYGNYNVSYPRIPKYIYPYNDLIIVVSVFDNSQFIQVTSKDIYQWFKNYKPESNFRYNFLP